LKTKIIAIVLGLTALAEVGTTSASTSNFASNFLFSNITIEDGLPSNFIDDIYKDRNGFIWLSTSSGGLLRYDGHDFLQFNNRSELPLKSNYVKQVCEDDFGRLWVATEKGIDILNINRNTKQDFNKTDTLFNSYVTGVSKDSKGSIWIISPDMIEKVDFNSEGEILLISKLDTKIKIVSPINALYDFYNQMLVGINNTVYKISSDEQGKLLLSEFSARLKSLNCFSIKCMIAKENELWVGTDRGLYRFNPITNIVKTYYHSDDDPHTITQNLISDLKIGYNGQLIVSTLRGLNFYNSMDDNFDVISKEDNSNNVNMLNCNFVNCMLCDDRTLWIGTEAGGLNKMKWPTLSVKNHVHSDDNPHSLSMGQINSIYIDNAENIYVGCVEGGLNYKHAGTTKWKHLTTADGLSHNTVSDIKPIGKNTLWLATWGEGINIFNTKTGRIAEYVQSKSDSINIDFVGIIQHDTTNNGVWIGSNRGFFFYDLETKEMTSPLPKHITENIVGVLGSTISNNNKLYAGTTKGIICVDLNSFKNDRKNFDCKLFKPDRNNPATAYRDKTTFYLETSDSTMYIGTDGYGLVKVTRTGTDTVVASITTADGLSNDIVCQILEDNTHKLWIATANGISCYVPTTRRFFNYYKQDGLCSNQFFWNGCFKNPTTNNLFFGGTQGIVEINSDNSNYTAGSEKVLFTRLVIGSKTIYPGDGHIDKDITNAEKIKLHEREKLFTIEFSALNYNNPQAVVYQYRLLGFNDNWTTISAPQRFVTFTNLAAGNYTLEVRNASNPESVSISSKIKISVTPYIYKTWYFLLIIFLLATAIIYKTIQLRLHNIQKQKDILEDKIKERTSELKNRTEELSQQNDILYQQNHEISEQKKKLEEMSLKIQELTMDKLAFFTNITHEFRTPLTLIIGPIDRALRLSTNPKVIEQLNFVSRNSKHLLSLVNQLMDFRKVDTDNMPINLAAGNFQTFIEDVVLPFRALAAEKMITINLLYRMPNPHIMFDREAMTKILTNLLGNALKFTSEGGRVNIYVASLKNPDRLFLCVSDNGQGIVKEDVEKIFARFYQSKGHKNIKSPGQSGSGIGLYLCKRLANLLGGDISALNNHKQGAMFRIVLPLKSVENESISPYGDNVGEEEFDPENIDDEIKDDSSRMTVLIVDDNADMRGYVRSVLAENYNVVEASCGKDAISLLHSHNINMILSDLMMPEMDGMQLLKNIKNDINISHIPFVMLTAKTARDAQIESLRCGADDYIIKPFDEDVLNAKITTVIENRRRFQQTFKTDMIAESLNINEDSNDKKFIDKALKLVRENYKNSEFEVADFVDAMGMGKTLLNKKMQNLIHQNTSQFIRNYRLKVARELIIKNRMRKDLNISEIAYEVGFNDPKYFTRCFTKHFNVTPSGMMNGDAEE